MASLNLREYTILTAERNAFTLSTIQGILRNLGGNKLFEAKDALDVLRVLSQQKIDILLCDTKLPAFGGFELVSAIRRNANNENRAVPILMLASTTNEATVRSARDAGAHMVLQKPISPSALHDRLQWVLQHPRQFVQTPNYTGPDRRFRIEGYPEGTGRRRSDANEPVADEAGPALPQGAIDDLFKSVQIGG